MKIEMNTSNNPNNKRRVVIVGAGSVGATYGYSLAQSGLADEIVILDKNEDLAHGQVLDLVHGQPFFPAVSIRMGDASDYTDARLVVITAGSAQKPGETRLQLIQKNAEIVGTIAFDVASSGCKGVMLIVSNPVDIMTQVALKRSGWKRGRVIGSGTVLDSSRFRYLLSKHCGVDVHNVHAYILGEHGDSEFAAWSMTHVAGIHIDEYCPLCNHCPDWKLDRSTIEREVRDSAYHIINYKGSTHYAVGLAMVRITAAILREEKSVLTVSTQLEGEYGIEGVCLSVPCILDGNGIDRIVESPLSADELVSLRRSAEILREAYLPLNEKSPA